MKNKKTELYPHAYFAKILLREASLSPDPFYSIIVNRETAEILARGGNQYTEGEPLLHSEMVAMMNLSKEQPDILRDDLTMYSTAEPCPMCACGMVYGGMHNVYFGITREELVQLGWIEFDIKAEEIFQRAFKKTGGFQYVAEEMPTAFKVACFNLFEKYKEDNPDALPTLPEQSKYVPSKL